MKILILGSNGMLGHMLYNYFKEKNYDVIGTLKEENSELYYDAFLDMENLENIVKKVNPDVVINCIGILNKAAEDNHYLALKLNGLLPHYIDELSKKYNFKFIHVSTDCVFSGKRGKYSEEDLPDALSFYGRSKAIGEINNDRNLTIRTSIVGPDINENGIGLFNWFMKQSNEINGYSKAIWSGVTTLQLAKTIEYLIKNDFSGLHNLVNNESISKHDLLKLFSKYSGKNIKINKDDNFCENKSLINSKSEFNNIIPSYEVMVKEMCEWIKLHKNLYNYDV